MLTPNMLRIGRNNERAWDGPLRLPGGGELLDKVQELYEAWFKIWNVSYIPKLMYQPKWWKQDRDLKEGDVIYFQKTESALDTCWTLGTIDQLVVGRDGLARRAVVKYQNSTEDFHRVSDRHVRSLVKIWSIDDQNIDEDLAELQRRLMATAQSCDLLDQLLRVGPAGHPQPMQGPGSAAAAVLLNSVCGECCCDTHCRFFHPAVQQPASSIMSALLARKAVDTHQVQLELEQDQGGEYEYQEQEELLHCDCSLTGLISSLSLNLH